MKLEPFCKLKDPATYRACNWNMHEDAEARDYWLTFFKKHISTVLGLGIAAAVRRGETEASARARAAACQADFVAFFDAYAADPQQHGQEVTMLTLDQWRDELLRRHGFVDAFVDLKQEENEKVIGLLPQVCQQIDKLEGREQFQAVVENVFAGNIFDMGAAGSAQLLLEGKLDFFQTRKKLPPRPWLIDSFVAFGDRIMMTTIWKKCVFFVDNAGADFMLGAVPFMRYLARRGTSVILAANERPTLNDMTVHDVRAWWPRVIEMEPSIEKLPIRIVSTGTGEPLIDLAAVSAELNDASRDADLVILEGMGRGVESNLDAEFSCEAANLAMIKDHMVAKRQHGKLYDVVCKYR